MRNLPSRKQELKAPRRIPGYAPITSLRISFGTPSIPGAVFAVSLPPTLFSSSKVKSSSRRTTQELRSYLWNGSTFAARHSRRSATNWSFHQYIEPLANDPAGTTQPNSSMILVISRWTLSLSLQSRLVFQEGLLPSLPPPLSTTWHRCSKSNSMHRWSLKFITSRTDQSLVLEAR